MYGKHTYSKLTQPPDSAVCTACERPEFEGTEPEAFVRCNTCESFVHPSCIGLQATQLSLISAYKWQCGECKQCETCHEHGDDDHLLFCDRCDRGYHTFCLKPPLKSVPEEDWLCQLCINAVKRSPMKKSDASKKKGSSISGTPNKTPLVSKIKKIKLTHSGGPKATPSNTAQSSSKRKGSPVKKGLLIKTPSATSSSAKKKTSTRKSESIFADILSAKDADISACQPTQKDQALFNETLLEADRALALKAQESLAAFPASQSDGSSSRIPRIQIGDYVIDTWYSAPYPEEYNTLSIMYICEFCLKYMKSEFVLQRHMAKCCSRHPPGDEIYRDNNISVFEVDGRQNKIYCQNICMLAKMFLDHKTLFYDTEPFLFYVLTERDENGFHFVGYFSKEKRSSTNYNLSCIVTLPIFQRKGYGNFLIDFSYLLSRRENKKGTPEKPLSDLGLLSYRRYWRSKILGILHTWDQDSLAIYDLTNATFMVEDDVISTLYLMDMIVKNTQGEYVVRINTDAVRDHVEALVSKNFPSAKMECLRWTPSPFKKSFFRGVVEQQKGEQDQGKSLDGVGTEDDATVKAIAEAARITNEALRETPRPSTSETCRPVL